MTPRYPEAPAAEAAPAEKVRDPVVTMVRVIQTRHQPLPASALAADAPADTEDKRRAVNSWIRDHSPADAVIDFDAAVRDPADPSRINPAFDGSDHLHFNLAGYRAMATAVGLDQLADPVCV